MSIMQPVPGKFLFNNHVFSAEEDSVGVFTLLGFQVARMPLGEYPLHMMFRYANNRYYAWAVCRSGARVWDVTDPTAPYPGTMMAATTGWKIMGGAVDHDTGYAYVVEDKRVGSTNLHDRKLWAWDIVNPMQPARNSETFLGQSQSGRGGLIEILGNINDRRLAAATFSAEHTAVVDITVFPHVVSATAPCFQAMDSRAGHLYGTDGDAIFNASERATGKRPSLYKRMRRGINMDISRWNVYGSLGSTPTRISHLACPGFLYDQTPNLSAFVKDGLRYFISGWTDGADSEYVSIVHVMSSGNLVEVKRLRMPLGILPAAIDFSAQNTIAFVWGYPPYQNGWEYYVVPIDIRVPAKANVLAPVEMRR